MNHINSSERTSSGSYITTKMAEKFLLQDNLYGFSMGKSLTKNRWKSPKVQWCGLKEFVFPELTHPISVYLFILRPRAIYSIAYSYCKSLPSDNCGSQKLC